MIYTFTYEIVVPNIEKTIKDSLKIEADSPARAKEFGEHLLEEKYPENSILLEASVA